MSMTKNKNEEKFDKTKENRKIKHRIEIVVTEEDEFMIEAQVKPEGDNPPQLVAFSMLETAIENIAEELNVTPEFLAEVLYHDFTKGKKLNKVKSKK